MVFVFLQVGNDPNVELMVDSIKLSNPFSKIIQCSDLDTNKINGVSEVFRISSDTNNLMTFRLEAFAKLNINEPAIYLDSDMLVLKKINITDLLNGSEIALCQRSFGLNEVFNSSYGGMDLSEYFNMKIIDVYPILACFTITKSNLFWIKCFENLLQIDKKFHKWYGDQEAIKNILELKIFKYNLLKESQVACLPEYFQSNDLPLCLHFKGAKRKTLMNKAYSVLKQNSILL